MRSKDSTRIAFDRFGDGPAVVLVAAWRGRPGCEATVLSNSILGRDDQLGWPVFSPIDEAEARQRTKVGEGRQPRPPSPRQRTRNAARASTRPTA